MFTPLRVTILAAVVGIAAAVVHSRLALDPPVDAALLAPPPMELAPGKQITTPSGLIYIDIAVGKGPQVQMGDTVAVQYLGRLRDGGVKFDSSYDRKPPQPLVFTVGQGKLKKAFEEGVLGMAAGGKRELVLAPSLGYGAEGAGDAIPPNATLVFDIELVGIKPPQ